MQDLPCKDIEVDELWSFVGKKERHVKPDDNPNEVETSIPLWPLIQRQS